MSEDNIRTHWLLMAVTLAASWLVGCRSQSSSNAREEDERDNNAATQPRIRSVTDISEVRRFKIKSGRSIWGVAFSPDGKYLASVAWGHLVLWDWRNGTKYKVMEDKDVNHRCVAFSPDGKEVVAGAGDGILRFWNVDSGKMVRTLGKHAGTITRVAFSRDSQRLIAAGHETKELVRVWDLKTDKVIYRATGALSTVYDVGFLADDSKAVGVGLIHDAPDYQGGTIWGFDPIEGIENVKDVPGHYFIAVAPFPKRPNKFIVASGAIGGLDVRDMNTGAVIQHIPGLSKTRVSAIAVTPDGRYVLTGGGGLAKEPPLDTTDCLVLWDLVKNKVIKKFSADDTVVPAVAFSPDGRFAASGGGECIVIWELKE